MLQLAVTVKGAGDAGLITKEETTAAGFLAYKRHQLLIRHEGAVVHAGNSTNVSTGLLGALLLGMWFSGVGAMIDAGRTPDSIARGTNKAS